MRPRHAAVFANLISYLINIAAYLNFRPGGRTGQNVDVHLPCVGVGHVAELFVQAHFLLCVSGRCSGEDAQIDGERGIRGEEAGRVGRGKGGEGERGERGEGGGGGEGGRERGEG